MGNRTSFQEHKKQCRSEKDANGYNLSHFVKLAIYLASESVHRFIWYNSGFEQHVLKNVIC